MAEKTRELTEKYTAEKVLKKVRLKRKKNLLKSTFS
jgi:hypothetical protein